LLGIHFVIIEIRAQVGQRVRQQGGSSGVGIGLGGGGGIGGVTLEWEEGIGEDGGMYLK
jgi:hypothetical protein